MVSLRKPRYVVHLSSVMHCTHCPQEISGLAHSPRAIAFVNNETLCWGHTPSDYCLTSLKTSVTIDVTTPILTATSGSSIGTMGMGALSGLGGYMTLGLGAKAKPNVISVRDDEALIAKDSERFTAIDVLCKLIRFARCRLRGEHRGQGGQE